MSDFREHFRVGDVITIPPSIVECVVTSVTETDVKIEPKQWCWMLWDMSVKTAAPVDSE